jgi:cellulose synthase/poly-beta-1,6-N-acetylglucosamine synthase-like glycosyltransferase
MAYKASLIISVYKDTQSLKVVLNCLRHQTEKNFEIIVSEDGEDEKMRRFIAEYNFENDYQHLSQEDMGWRKNMALNNAIKAAKSEWLIFIDGDCVLHPRFIEHHVKLADENYILAGKRIKLNPRLSDLFSRDDEAIFKMQQILLKLVFRSGREELGFYEEGIFIDPSGFFGFVPRLRKMTKLLGSNMSFSKNAAIAINGFDEDYILPAAGEDADLCWRFKGCGYRLRSLRNIAVQYHLYHKLNWTNQDINLDMMSAKQSRSEYICRNGLEKR